MDKIIISDLEVFYAVGVTAEERAQPQRLLITEELTHDFKAAASSDNLAETIDYYSVSQRVLHFGDDCHWELIETVASDLAALILDDYKPRTVMVEVKKFIIPQARYVAVSVIRPR